MPDNKLKMPMPLIAVIVAVLVSSLLSVMIIAMVKGAWILGVIMGLIVIVILGTIYFLFFWKKKLAEMDERAMKIQHESAFITLWAIYTIGAFGGLALFIAGARLNNVDIQRFAYFASGTGLAVMFLHSFISMIVGKKYGPGKNAE